MRKPNTYEEEFVEKILSKYLLGIIISREGGDILYKFHVDDSIRQDLISQFIAALAMFGEENLGKISRIIIKGLDIELSIFSKYGLILTIFYHANMVNDYLDEEAKKGLDRFYHMFQSQIEEGRLNQSIYEKFDPIMWSVIREYLVRIGILSKEVGLAADFDFIIG